MFRMFVVAGVAVLLSAEAATAGDARCLWRSLSVGTQEAMIARAKAGQTVLEGLSPMETHNAGSGCLVAKENGKAAAQALVAIAEENAAAENVDQAFIDGARQFRETWDSLRSEDRAAFRQWAYSTLMHKPAALTEQQAFGPIREALASRQFFPNRGTSTPPGHLRMYFVWRAAREQFETLF